MNAVISMRVYFVDRMRVIFQPKKKITYVRSLCRMTKTFIIHIFVDGKKYCICIDASYKIISMRTVHILYHLFCVFTLVPGHHRHVFHSQVHIFFTYSNFECFFCVFIVLNHLNPNQEKNGKLKNYPKYEVGFLKFENHKSFKQYSN